MFINKKHRVSISWIFMTSIFIILIPSLTKAEQSKYLKKQTVEPSISLNCNFENISIYNKIDLRKNMQPVYDQGSVNNCVAQSVAGSIEYQFKNRKGKDFKPSASYTYYMTRKTLDLEEQNASMSLLRTIKSTQEYGLLERSKFPESSTEYTISPNFTNLFDGLKTKITSYEELHNFDEIIKYLQNDIPVIFSTNVIEWGDIEDDGKVSNALSWNKRFNKIWGHCMLIVGYYPSYKINEDVCPVFIIRDSHGEKVGDKGYYYIPIINLLKYNNQKLFIVRIDEDELNEIYK